MGRAHLTPHTLLEDSELKGCPDVVSFNSPQSSRRHPSYLWQPGDREGRRPENMDWHNGGLSDHCYTHWISCFCPLLFYSCIYSELFLLVFPSKVSALAWQVREWVRLYMGDWRTESLRTAVTASGQWKQCVSSDGQFILGRNTWDYGTGLLIILKLHPWKPFCAHEPRASEKKPRVHKTICKHLNWFWIFLHILKSFRLINKTIYYSCLFAMCVDQRYRNPRVQAQLPPQPPGRILVNHYRFISDSPAIGCLEQKKTMCLQSIQQKL